jgi:hypothetical protein
MGRGSGGKRGDLGFSRSPFRVVERDSDLDGGAGSGGKAVGAAVSTRCRRRAIGSYGGPTCSWNMASRPREMTSWKSLIRPAIFVETAGFNSSDSPRRLTSSENR